MPIVYAQVSQEFVQFDDEDQGNLNAYSRVTPYGPTEDPYNTRIYYCYYKPGNSYRIAVITVEPEVQRFPCKSA